MIGIYDFTYSPYALGDALTGQMNLAVLAEEHGYAAIDQKLLIDEKYPASRRWQPFINALSPHLCRRHRQPLSGLFVLSHAT